MLPEKVGPARKILTYLKREQKQYKDTLQLPSQDTQGVDSNVFGSTSSSKSINQPGKNRLMTQMKLQDQLPIQKSVSHPAVTVS